jgi:hypothetical protein
MQPRQLVATPRYAATLLSPALSSAPPVLMVYLDAMRLLVM